MLDVTLTPPVPESCMWENPVISLLSDAKPPCFSSGLFTSADAFAIPKNYQEPLYFSVRSCYIPKGSVAPGNTCPAA
jgi:hypothetical protein